MSSAVVDRRVHHGEQHTAADWAGTPSPCHDWRHMEGRLGQIATDRASTSKVSRGDFSPLYGSSGAIEASPPSTALQGGVPIKLDGKAIGAVGVSGETPQVDEGIAPRGRERVQIVGRDVHCAAIGSHPPPSRSSPQAQRGHHFRASAWPARTRNIRRGCSAATIPGPFTPRLETNCVRRTQSTRSAALLSSELDELRRTHDDSRKSAIHRQSPHHGWPGRRFSQRRWPPGRQAFVSWRPGTGTSPELSREKNVSVNHRAKEMRA